MQRRWPVLLRGLLAAVLLVTLVAGLPVLLIQEVGWPLPTAMPAWEQVTQTLATGAIEDATIIKSLAVLVWLSWANFSAGVLVEVVGLVRGRTALRVTGLWAAQHLAANLLATASFALAALSRPATAPTADPGELRLAVAAALTEQPPELVDLRHHENARGVDAIPRAVLQSVDGSADGSSPPGVQTGREYDVQRGDTLWDLSERFLGDGLRWREIRETNIGRVQPDGSRIDADTEDLRPGWGLLMPTRAQPSASPATLADAFQGQDSVKVDLGDTLWDLADERLDDPYRWPEIYRENRGIPQADGRALTDPDLIHPGWVLDLPVPKVDSSGTEPPVEPEDNGSVEEPAPSNGHVPQSGHVLSEERNRDSGTQDGEEGDGGFVFEPPSAALEQRSRGSEAPAGEAGTSTNEENEDGTVAVVPVAAAASLAAGLILTLDRIRRARLRRREAGRRIPLPTGDSRQAEQRLRALADPEEAQFVDDALRELASHYSAHRPLPPIVMVSYGPEDLVVHLDVSDGAPPDGWDPDDGDLIWTRPRPTGTESLDDEGGTPSRLPALVTLGVLSDDRVALLNLGHTACLHLDGHPEAARDLLGLWALELATTRRADALDVVAVGLCDLPSGLERLTATNEPEELRALLNRSHSNGQTNTPKMVILAVDLPPETATLVRTTTEMRHDVVAAMLGLQPRSGDAVLHLDSEGSARLEPGDVAVRHHDFTAVGVPVTARLLEQALHDPDELVPIPELPEDDLEAGHLKGPVPDQVAEPEPPIEVRVLGPVEIVGAAQPFRTNKTIELIVHLAMHRGGASMDTLMEALWPNQEPRAARLHTEASRARKALGVADDGSALFPDAELGRYRLAPSVALDYDRFASHVEGARRDPSRAIDHLRSALTLVRGVPLSSTATEYAWATNEFYRLSQEVVDAAHHLAQLCHEGERYDDAIWAAERGLAADPLAEVLVRDLIEAAVATGNTARAHAAMTRLRRHTAEEGDANDADDWLHPETIAAFQRLSMSGRARPKP